MNETIEIITNNVPRQITNAFELTSRQWKQLGADKEEREKSIEDGESFVIYKNYPVRLGDFMTLDKNSPFSSFWHGYSSDSFFSGILIHICEDDQDFVIVGRYFS